MHGFGVEQAICNRTDCGGIAAWRIGAKVWARGTPHFSDNCVVVRFPLLVCDPCKDKTKIDDMVDDQGWRKIVKSVRKSGKPAPERSSLVLDFAPLLMGRA